MKSSVKITKRHYLVPSVTALFFLIGCVGFFAVSAAVKSKTVALGYDLKSPPVFYENFSLFKDFSLWICIILLVLTVASMLIYTLAWGKRTMFSQIVAEIAPLLCAAVLVATGIFFAYLTEGGEYPITAAIVSLSIFEAMTFALPFSLGGFISLAAKKSKGI